MLDCLELFGYVFWGLVYTPNTPLSTYQKVYEMLDYEAIRDTLGMCMMIYTLTYMCLVAYETRYVTYHATATEVYRE